MHLALIQKSEIEEMFQPDVYRRGREYYFQGRVGKLNYDPVSGICQTFVQGNDSYLVRVNIQDFPRNLAMYCDCPAFDQHFECKHVVAAMFEICNKEAEIVNAGGFSAEKKYDAAQGLLYLTGTLSGHESIHGMHKEHLKVEFLCDFTNPYALFVELKAGVDRLYVVRDAGDFIRSVREGKEYFFTKKFTYSPDDHMIDPEDLEVLDELYGIIENERLYAEGVRYGQYSPSIYSTARSVMIPPSFFPPLLKKMTSRALTGKSGSKEFKQVTIADGPLPFHYELGKSEERDLELLLPHADHIIHSRPYELVFLDGQVYFPGKDLLPLIDQLIRLQSKHSRILISADQAEAFVSEVVPKLNKLGKVEVAEKVQEHIIQFPLKAAAYMELDDDTVKAKLEYRYGDIIVNPFMPAEDNGKILVRDVEKEQEIMGIIENAGMRYNGKELHLPLAEEDLYDFLFLSLPALGERCELYLTDGLRNMIYAEQPSPKTSIRTEESAGLLEISFQMEGLDEEEIAEIMKTAVEKKRFYRMKNGAFLSLETEEFQTLQTLFTDLKIDKEELSEGSLHVPIYRGVQVDEVLGMKEKYDPSFRKLLDHLKHPEEQSYLIPAELNATMRDYQTTGFRWFSSLSHYHLGGILADDMGLGKTLQSIAYLLSVRKGNQHMIVAPASLIYNWQSEWEKFAPDMDVAVIAGSREEREQILKERDGVEVLITSYSTLRQDIDLYGGRQFHTVILDEAQFIKNYTTKSAAAVRNLTASRKFALSGTPIENSVDELWGIFQAIMPGLFPPLKDFKKLEPGKVASLIKPFILRRLKSDVLKELPEKIESTHITELSKEQKELYVGYLHRIQEETAASLRGEGFQKSRMKILAGITRLRQLCCHPALFLENYEGKSGKLEQLLDIVESSVENGKRMLIFSQFTSMLEMIQAELEKADYPHFYLHGQTPAKERLRMADQFNQGDKPIFLISLKAGGTGLNLTAADTVVLYDLWWNPAVEDQAAGRAHRFGQKNVVQVIRLITKGTIEEKIYELQQKKRELIEQVIQPGETMLSSLSEDDIKEILSI